jgi:hypothetical protein
MTNNSKIETPQLVATVDLLGLLGNYATAEDIEAEKKHFDEGTPLEIVIISAILKGLEDFAQGTANDEISDGFSGEDACNRAMAYYETREQLHAYWSRLP